MAKRVGLSVFSIERGGGGLDSPDTERNLLSNTSLTVTPSNLVRSLCSLEGEDRRSSTTVIRFFQGGP